MGWGAGGMEPDRERNPVKKKPKLSHSTWEDSEHKSYSQQGFNITCEKRGNSDFSAWTRQLPRPGTKKVGAMHTHQGRHGRLGFRYLVQEIRDLDLALDADQCPMSAAAERGRATTRSVGTEIARRGPLRGPSARRSMDEGTQAATFLTTLGGSRLQQP